MKGRQNMEIPNLSHNARVDLFELKIAGSVHYELLTDGTEAARRATVNRSMTANHNRLTKSNDAIAQCRHNF